MSTNLADNADYNDLLDQLPSEELTECARLLAFSIAHHRAKFGVIPLAASNAENRRSPSTNNAIALRHAADQSIDEALTLVRREQARQAERLARQQAESNQAALDDKRRQMRISVSAGVQLTNLDGSVTHPATLKNISWGGASVRCQDLDIAVGGRLVLLLPAAGKQPIRIEATLLRESLSDDQREFGMRFDSLDPDDEERLLEVLQLLLKSPDPDPRRSEVRLVQRLEVEYGDAGEFHAVLEDISCHGMMLTVPDPIEIGEILLISLSSVDTPFALNLRAKVVHQTLIDDCEFDMYRIGLEFEHPDQRVHERISSVLHELAMIRLRDASLDELEADEFSTAAHPTTPTAASNA